LTNRRSRRHRLADPSSEPIVDRLLIADPPIALFRSPEASSMPVLVTSTDTEVAFSLFPLMFVGPIDTAGDFVNALKPFVPAQIVSRIQSVYPLADSDVEAGG
jgi:hypothetical protein